MYAPIKNSILYYNIFVLELNAFSMILDNQAIIANDQAIYILMTSCINQIIKWQHVGLFHLNEKDKTNRKNDILIAYYSGSGNTRKIAELKK